TRETRGRPGTRAPHLMIEQNGQAISILDLFGRDFVLLAGPEGDAWSACARDAARDVHLGLDVHRITTRGFADAYGIAPSGAVLVRPDGFVGWRAQNEADASASTLRGVLSSILARRST